MCTVCRDAQFVNFRKPCLATGLCDIDDELYETDEQSHIV